MASAVRPGRRAGYTQVIESIYDAALDAAGWPMALDTVRAYLDADSALLRVYGPNHGSVLQATTIGFDSTFVRAYGEEFVRDDPIVPIIESLTPGDMTILEERLPFNRLRHMRFYCEYLKPQDKRHIMGGPLLRDARLDVMIGLQRGHEAAAFGARELTLVNRLVPHLMKALRLADRLERACLVARLADKMLGAAAPGMLLFDRQGRVVFLNPAAEALLTSQSQLTLRDGRLRAQYRALQQWLDVVTMVADRDAHCPGWEGSSARFTAFDGSEDVALAVLPWNETTQSFASTVAGAVTVGVLTPLNSREGYSVRLIQSLFGLTPGEARLTEALVSTGTLEGAAQKLDIKISTARDRLKSVFRKTGFTSQSALIAAVLRSPTGAALDRSPGEHWTAAGS